MSYILDALRRAEADRQRGQVPGLGAQPAPAPADGDAPARLPAWGWAVAAVAMIALLLAALWSRPPAVPVAVVPAVAPTAAVPIAPLPITAPPMPLVVSAAALPVAAVPPPAAVAAPPPPRADPPPTPLAALSADQRRELPPLVVGGSIWSDSAAQRFVIVNGQVVHEGEAAASGVQIERITPKSAIVRWRELRIELPL